MKVKKTIEWFAKKLFHKVRCSCGKWCDYQRDEKCDGHTCCSCGIVSISFRFTPEFDERPSVNEEKKTIFVLCPGTVTSRSDGQTHMIKARELARLYGVDFRKCVIDDDDRSLRGIDWDKYEAVFLYPQEDGDYDLEKVIADKKMETRFLCTEAYCKKSFCSCRPDAVDRCPHCGSHHITLYGDGSDDVCKYVVLKKVFTKNF